MAAVVLTRHGGPEALDWRIVPVPEPGPGEALVRVLAAGVNATDINTRVGWYGAGEAAGWSGALAFPRIQGSDLCGRVVAHGDGVSAPPLGARVICPTTQDDPDGARAIGSDYDGAFAQYCAVPARHLHDVTDAPLRDTELGAIPCSHGAAQAMVRRAGIGPGETVLVTGASGGVGLAAVELARQAGARVIGQCSPAHAEAVAEAGGEPLGRDAPLPPLDAVIDVVGGPGWGARIAALRPGGRCAVAGAVAGPVVETDLRRIYLGDLTIHGCTRQRPGDFEALVALVNAGRIRPRIAATYPLQDIARAQADFAAGGAGKRVLIPPETLA
jgi:alcohol dehydrogenase